MENITQELSNVNNGKYYNVDSKYLLANIMNYDSEMKCLSIIWKYL